MTLGFFDVNEARLSSEKFNLRLLPRLIIIVHVELGEGHGVGQDWLIGADVWVLALFVLLVVFLVLLDPIVRLGFIEVDLLCQIESLTKMKCVRKLKQKKKKQNNFR